MRQIEINANQSGQRFDKFLQKYMREATKSFIYKMLRKKNITLNGKKAQGNEKLEPGDKVVLFFSEETLEKFCGGQPRKKEGKKAAFPILYEDEQILVINKPAGMLSQKAKPEDVKLIMVDPKVVELSVYNGIPHLMIPVVTDPKKAAGALNWAVAEMNRRYQLFAEYNVRDLKGYNDKVENIKDIDDPNKAQKLPQIVIIVDELADLMMVAPGEVEEAICRLAQLARAAGLHLVLATQRPSVNVITGLIKANMPSRIAFSVSSGVDSRTIIDMNGAEKLLGKGDMLFYPAGYQKPVRVQGAFVSDKEVQAVVDFLKENSGGAAYSEEIQKQVNSNQNVSAGGASSEDDKDVYFVDAGKFIIEKDKASIGMLQRVFKIGFNRAARIMDQLAEAGVVGEEEGTKPRKVLMSMEQFEQYIEESV